jgi:hypothetical protein
MKFLCQYSDICFTVEYINTLFYYHLPFYLTLLTFVLTGYGEEKKGGGVGDLQKWKCSNNTKQMGIREVKNSFEEL